jgi:hypothetical protein
LGLFAERRRVYRRGADGRCGTATLSIGLRWHLRKGFAGSPRNSLTQPIG